MIKLSKFILVAIILVMGCESSQYSSDSHHNQVYREIERLKAESERSSIGSNIRIEVNLLSISESDHFAIDSLLQYVDKNVTVTKRPEVYSQSGLLVGVAGENFRARLDVTKRQVKSSEETELFLVLADGSTGYINIGEEIAVPQFVYNGRWYRGIEYRFRQAGRSFRVTARKLHNGLIDMELIPVFSRFLSDGGDLELTELSVRVTARPGQALVIGGGDTEETNVARALLGYGKMGEKKQTLITVTPYIQ